MKFAIIAAVDSKMGIGKAGTLPWRLKGDMDHFREITTKEWVPGKQNVVIMGRTTWLSLPERHRPLPGRINIILSGEPVALPQGVERATTFDSALQAAAAQNPGKIFIIGGGSVYTQGIVRPECGELFLTRVQGDFGCDVKFPEVPSIYKLTSTSEPVQEGSINYVYETYART